MNWEWDGFSGVIGAIIALIGTLAGNYISNKSNEKVANLNRETQESIAENQQKLEWIKLFREHDFDKLTYVLYPIKNIYMQSDRFLEQFYIDDNTNRFGDGLHEGYISKVKKIIEDHTHLVTFEMQEKFFELSDVENKRRFENENTEKIMREIKIAKKDKNVLPIEDFSFDHDREFIELVEKEVSGIEEKFNL